MLNIEQLSYWERSRYFEGIDFLIIGAGIVGYSAALKLRSAHPTAKIVIMEQGYLPSGASTKNAGFSCFGSASELLSDLETMPEDTVWSTVEKRWKGLQRLKEIIGDDLRQEVHGSWDLFMPAEKELESKVCSQMSYLNAKIQEITGEDHVYSLDTAVSGKFGFEGISSSCYNRLEGQIDTGSMMQRFHQKAIEANIMVLFGISVVALQSALYNVQMQTSVGFLTAGDVLICTNGFARQFLPQHDVQPARAQVLVTTPIDDLKVKGTFHYQSGYYYFRNINDRILIGGGRNLNFEGETTTTFANTAQITDALKEMLSTIVLPNTEFSIAYEWSGIMGVGKTKAPIVDRIDQHIAVGVRMGGMGVAIGSLVGEELAGLFA
jgi:gamma-glutamylputrescine oxidase